MTPEEEQNLLTNVARLATVFEAQRADMSALKDEVSAQRADFTNLVKRVDTLETNLTKKIAEVETKLGERIATVETKLGERIAMVETKLSERIGAVETKLGEKIDEVDARLTRQVDFLAININRVIVRGDENFQVVSALRDAQNHMSAELEAVKFTMARLEGRVVGLENSLAELRQIVATKEDILQIDGFIRALHQDTDQRFVSMLQELSALRDRVIRLEQHIA